MKLMLVGDVHASDRPPSVRTEQYTEDILLKLRFASVQAAANGCDALVQAGDVFHIKAPGRSSHKLVQAVHEALTEGGCPVLIVPGNHDMSHDRLDSLDKQPLGSLTKMDGIELLLGWHPRLPLFGLPYLADWQNDLDEWMYLWLDKSRLQSSWNLMVTHAPIFPPGERPPYEFIPSEEWAERMIIGACYYGHIHDSHGFYGGTSSQGIVHFCNNGALSRGSLHEQTLKREPAITLYDDDDALPADQMFTRIVVPHRPASEVFRLADVEAKLEQQGRLDEFLEEIGQTSLPVSGAEEVLKAVESMGLRPETKQAIGECVEEAASR